MEKNILLKEATRDELIDELIKRASITNLKVDHGNGASIESMNGRIAISDESYVFVIKPSNYN